MHSDLPIVTPDPPPSPRSQAEKYGGLYYLGLGGLVFVVALITWFGTRAWSMRDLFQRIYVLHDGSRSEHERTEAAQALATDPRLTARQAWDIVLRKDLPAQARYVIAESLTSEAVATDPRGYALVVARSAEWPGWLRVLLARPIALAAGEGIRVPREPIEELASADDPVLAIWANHALALLGDAHGRAALMRVEGPNAELARWLIEALESKGPRRDAALRAATQWLRDHHPDAVAVWNTEAPRRRSGTVGGSEE